MFIGYSDEHAPDTYRFYVLATKRIVIARDVLWFNVMYYKAKPNIIHELNINIDL